MKKQKTQDTQTIKRIKHRIKYTKKKQEKTKSKKKENQNINSKAKRMV